jgi:lipopolysaccharide/colanic/teichoic acid biosynthesis glycosyltransferase
MGNISIAPTFVSIVNRSIRYQVLPGITGLWQMSWRFYLNDFHQAARLDLYYIIDNWTLNLDFKILVETLRIVLFANGAY